MNTQNLSRIVYAAAAVAVVLLLLAFVPPRNTIVLKHDGFHPRTLTVQAGETVIFRSERGKYFWPASDFHPNHLLYPLFDAKEPVPPSESWSFAFSEPGVYPFHDHLAAYYSGIIRVADSAGEVPDNCMAHGGVMQCWQNTVFLALAEKGVDAAYDAMLALFESDPQFGPSCHGVAHNVGLASYQFYQEDPDFIYSTKALACGGGFYHGFMEGYLGETGSVEDAARVCDKVGVAVGATAPDARLQCYHGIGHGAVETTIATTGSFGSEDSFIQSALALCERASAGGEERYRCASGIYNGIANFYINGSYGLSVGKEDPLLLCARQPETYKESCYGNMNSVVLWDADEDFTKAAYQVISIPDFAHRKAALEYLASLYVTHHLKDTSYASVAAECRALPGAYPENCIRGFAHGLLEHGTPGEEYKQALAFCREPAFNDEEKGTCRDAVMSALSGRYSAEVVQAICASVTEGERAYCKP